MEDSRLKPAAGRACPAGWRDALLILALGAFALVPQLLARDVWAPDETRFAEVAREMRARGDYLVPHLNGEIYAEKPPLFFWFTAALWRAFGPNSGRIVAVAAALGVLLLTYAIGRRLYGRREGLWAAVITLSSLLFLGIAQCGILDTLLCLAILAAIAAGLAALRLRGRAAGRAWLAAYAAVAAAVLTKGPIGLAIPGLVLLVYAVACRREVAAGGWWHLAGALLLLALIAAWVLPAALWGGRAYATKIIVQQTLQRMRSGGVHGEQFYYYLKWYGPYFFPWSLLLPLALASAWGAARREQTWRDALPALWFVSVFVFLSLISGKRERYLLPAVPAAGLLCARYLCAAAEGRLPWPRWHRALGRATALLLLSASALLFTAGLAPAALAQLLPTGSGTSAAVHDLLATGHASILLASAALLAILAIAVLCLPFGGRVELWRAGALASTTLVIALALDLTALPALDRDKSPRRLVQKAMPYLDASDQVYLLESDFGGVFNLHTHWTGIPQLERRHGVPAALASKQRVAIVAWRKLATKLALQHGAHVLALGREGANNMALLLNWRPEEQLR